MRFPRRKAKRAESPELREARRQRKLSERLKHDAYALAAELEQLRAENHFAESITLNVLRGHAHDSDAHS